MSWFKLLAPDDDDYYYEEVEDLVPPTEKPLKKIDGMKCSHCLEYFHFAEPNQPDGTMICFQCRENPYR